MNPYLEQLKQELTDYQTKYGLERSASVLDILWYCYSAANPIDDGRIAAAEDALGPVYDELSFSASEVLFGQISELCTAYQRAAFLEGILLGMNLSKELA